LATIELTKTNVGQERDRTVRAKNNKIAPGDPYDIEFTDKRVSGWGGLAVIFEFLGRSGAFAVLGQALPDGRTSPNRIEVLDYARSLFAMVLIAGSRFAHVERLKFDSVIAVIAKIARVPTGMSLTRYFGAFTAAQVQHLREQCARLVRAWLNERAEGHTLDLDSTVFARYGEHDGATKGYNPKRRGGMMHHPLLAMLAEEKVIIHACLRAGNASPLGGICGFFDETLAAMQGHRVRLVRADSGFFSNEFLLHLESQNIAYTMAMKMSRPVQRFIRRIEAWTVIEQGLEIAETPYDPQRWIEPRRLIVVREHRTRRNSRRSETMFALDDYTYRVMVTTQTTPPVEVWREYNGRGDCENRIKELKLDFAADSFALHSFHGTDAVFQLVCFLFNAIAIFKKTVLQDTKPTLGKLRTQILVVGCTVGRSARRQVIRLGLKGGLRDRFQRLWQAAISLSIPTVMQFMQPPTGEELLLAPAWSVRVDPLRRLRQL